MFTKKDKPQQASEEINKTLADEIFITDTNGVQSVPDDFLGDLYGSEVKWQPIKFGEFITGFYRGVKTINPRSGKKPFIIGLLEDSTGTIHSLSGHALTVKLLPMYPLGVNIRITYIGDIKVNQPEPMKNFRIDVAKADMPKVIKYRAEIVGKNGDLPF